MNDTSIKDNTYVILNRQFLLIRCIYKGVYHNIYLAVTKQKTSDFYIVKLSNMLHEHMKHEEKVLIRLKTSKNA